MSVILETITLPKFIELILLTKLINLMEFFKPFIDRILNVCVSQLPLFTTEPFK